MKNNYFLSGSGKSFTMFGRQNVAGILSRSVEFILNHRPITVSVVELMGSNCYDLTSGQKTLLLNESSAKQVSISSIDEFDRFVCKIISIRSQKPTNQNLTSSRSHLMFKFGFAGNSNGNMAFMDLAGWESPYGKPDMEETKFINSSLSDLNTVLANISKGKIPYFKSKLAKFFKPYLSSGGKTVMFYHISNITAKKGLENVKDVVASTKNIKRPNSEALRDITNKRTMF